MHYLLPGKLDRAVRIADPRTMRASAVAQAALSLTLWACSVTHPPADPTAAAIAPSPASSPALAASANCPGDTWPPYDLGGIPGIAARSIDRATVELTNRTDRTWYYRAAGWQVEQLETCRGLLEFEIERGPIAAGAAVQVALAAFGERIDVPITIAFWNEPCGEACQRAPVAAILVVRSPDEPASS
jgi:hypothetical protein